MNREERDKIVEEAIRGSKSRGPSAYKVRSVMNLLFLVCAVIGLVLYFALPDRHIIGMAVIGAGMFFKIIEFFLRFLF